MSRDVALQDGMAFAGLFRARNDRPSVNHSEYRFRASDVTPQVDRTDGDRNSLEPLRWKDVVSVEDLECCCMATFLQRYQAGEYIAVWEELVALQDKVRDRRYKADALAVATETMRPARHNVEILIRRLDEMGYRLCHHGGQV